MLRGLSKSLLAIMVARRYRKMLKKKRRRPKKKDVDYTKSLWWREYVESEEVRDPQSASGKIFRRRFRVPYPLFERLMELAIELGYERRPIDCCGRKGIPLELKVGRYCTIG